MFEDANVIYNPVTGGTHLCDDYALALLALLDNRALSREVLISSVCSVLNQPEEKVVRDEILGSIANLQGFGLIVCADAPTPH